MWVGEVRRGRQRIQKLFGSKRKALDWEKDQKDIPAENWKIATESSLGEMALDYLDYSKSKHSAKTYQTKKSVFGRFFVYSDPDIPPDKLRADQVFFYLQDQFKKRSGYAANKDRKNLLAFTSWLWRYKEIRSTAVSSCERFPEERSPRYIPPEEDFWKVYGEAPTQDQVMLLAYLHLAARRSELFRLKWEDVDFSRSQIRLTTRKTKDGSWKAHWLPMTPRLSSALLDHRQGQDEKNELVFLDPRTNLPYVNRLHRMHDLCQKAGVKFFGFHAIRHLTASLLAKAGVPMITIQQILRHESLATTERYLHSLGDLRRALESVF